MLLIRTQFSKQCTEQAGRILLQEIASIREAREFDVPNSTLTTRVNAVPNWPFISELTEIEPESLQKWTFSMESRGAAH